MSSPSADCDRPEATCERCGRPNIVWFADSILWNLVNPAEGILCPVCFAQQAEANGIVPTAWKLGPEAPLAYTAVPDPDHPGRVILYGVTPTFTYPAREVVATHLQTGEKTYTPAIEGRWSMPFMLPGQYEIEYRYE